jgi:hypothetical protein
MMGMGKKDFTTCLPIPPPSSTQGKARAVGQTCLGASSSG